LDDKGERKLKKKGGDPGPPPFYLKARLSGCGCDFLIPFPRPAGTPPRRLGRCVIVGRDCGRKHFEGNPLLAAILLFIAAHGPGGADATRRRRRGIPLFAPFAFLTLFAPLLRAAALNLRLAGPFLAIVTPAAIGASDALRALIAIKTIVPIPTIAVVAIITIVTIVADTGRLVLIIILVGRIIIALAPLLLEAGAAFVQHTEIMVRELQIIFGLDAITLKLGVPSQGFIFLKKLARISARAVFLTIVSRVRRLVRRAGSAAAAAPAAVLTIVDQTQVLVFVVLNIATSSAGPLPAGNLCANSLAGGHIMAPATSGQDRPRTSEQSGVGDGQPHAI
jgi:hypothetical protein